MRTLGLLALLLVASGCTIHVVNEPTSATTLQAATIPVTAPSGEPRATSRAVRRARSAAAARDDHAQRTARAAPPVTQTPEPALAPGPRSSLAVRPGATRPHAKPNEPPRGPKRFADTVPEPRDAADYEIKRRSRSTSVAKAQ